MIDRFAQEKFKQLQAQAKKGNLDAQNELGKAFCAGEIVKRDAMVEDLEKELEHLLAE